MKPRSKILLLVALPALAIGLCGAWFLLRTYLLQNGLDRGLFALHQYGIRTAHSAVEWENAWTAKLGFLRGSFDGQEVLDARGITIHLKPKFSLSGRQWVERMDVDQLELNWKGWQMLGKGSCEPAALAGTWRGDVRKGNLGDGKMAVSAQFGLFSTGMERKQGMFRGNVGLEIRHLQVSHPAIGAGTKTIRELACWAKVEAGNSRFSLQPGTILRVGASDTTTLQAHPSGHWDASKRAFACALQLPTQPAQGMLDLAAALAPEWLHGIRATGTVAGQWRISGDLDNLNELALDGHLDEDAISVTQYGAADLTTLKTLAANPKLVQLQDLPPYLVEAVVLSEDAGFRTHQGFDPEIIRLSLIEDLQARRFVRGAGTIPMQLIRNTFLHHGKQLDRKLAEVTLTWLAESQHLLTKDEQLTLYLNRIEWGPQVHGIREAAAHYFHKPPRQLTVDEAIFLACVIPNPLHASALLQPDGSLTDYTREYFDSMRWMLYEGDWIGEEWLEAGYPRFLVGV